MDGLTIDEQIGSSCVELRRTKFVNSKCRRLEEFPRTARHWWGKIVCFLYPLSHNR